MYGVCARGCVGGVGGGLAFALNRVDILSLLWKVERTLETLGERREGGSSKTSTGRVGTWNRRGVCACVCKRGVIFIQFIQCRLLLTPQVRW